MEFHHRHPRRRLLRTAIVVGILAFTAWSFVLRRRPPEKHNQETRLLSPSSPTYTGSERCAACHSQEAGSWRNSHHARAMQPANDSTVLGDFRSRRFTKDGVTSSFYLKDGK